MAGHSQFKNIMYRKGAQDKKRAKLFAKLGRELMVAAKEGGADPSGNPRLRSAIATARSNMNQVPLVLLLFARNCHIDATISQELDKL